MPAISFAISGSSGGQRICTPSDVAAPALPEMALVDVDVLGDDVLVPAPVPVAVAPAPAVTVVIAFWTTLLPITLLVIAPLLVLLGRLVGEPAGDVGVSEPGVPVEPFNVPAVPSPPDVPPVSEPVTCAHAGAASETERTKAAASARIAINPRLYRSPTLLEAGDDVRVWSRIAARPAPAVRCAHGRAPAASAL